MLYTIERFDLHRSLQDGGAIDLAHAPAADQYVRAILEPPLPAAKHRQEPQQAAIPAAAAQRVKHGDIATPVTVDIATHCVARFRQLDTRHFFRVSRDPAPDCRIRNATGRCSRSCSATAGPQRGPQHGSGQAQARTL